jgi:hypothetical protein
MFSKRRMVAWVGALGMAALFAACSSSTPTAQVTTTTAKALPPGSTFSTKAGTGSEAVTITSPPKKEWKLVWHFDCGTTKGAFAFAIRKSGAKTATKVISQTGLGGGGYRTYSAGKYIVTMTTKCPWTLKAETEKAS